MERLIKHWREDKDTRKTRGLPKRLNKDEKTGKGYEGRTSHVVKTNNSQIDYVVGMLTM